MLKGWKIGQRRVKASSLQARLRTLYIKITLGVILLVVCLYAAFLVGELSYMMSLAPPAQGEALPALQGYPIAVGLVMVLLTFIAAPFVGGWFGTIATRSLVRRIQHLTRATRQVTEGEYLQRVQVSDPDELRQLEQHFNEMAEQLATSVAQQRELAGQAARLAERTRLSRELHDAISQDLFSLATLTAGLQTALPADSPLQRQVVTLAHTARNMQREMRALLLELRPTQLEELGLMDSLQALAAAYRTRLGMEIITKLEPVCVPPEREEALLRIAQEAVSNAVRHAGASRITLALLLLREEVELSIIDNGRGFDLEGARNSHGLGLRLMQERVQEAGGTLNLCTSPEEGTRITIRLRKAEQA